MGNHQQATLADYVDVLRRRKWVVVIAILLTTASAIAYSSQQAKQFQSSAQVFVNPSAQEGSIGPADVQARFLSTDAKLVHTPAVAAAAIRSAQVPGVTVPELLARSSVTPDASTNILTITVTDPAGSRAESLANAYALAVSDETKRLVVLSVDGAIKKLQDAIRQQNAQIDAAKKSGFVPPEPSSKPQPELATARSRTTNQADAACSCRGIATRGGSRPDTAEDRSRRPCWLRCWTCNWHWSGVHARGSRRPRPINR